MHHQITPGAVVQTADQIELRVRALEGNVAELEAFDGSFVGFRHVSSLTVCLPPATQTVPAQSLAAAAGAGQGAGTHSYLWRQVFFTEPVGQFLCVGGHSCGWSIKRSTAASLRRVERHRA